jgi:hypothetical protein
MPAVKFHRKTAMTGPVVTTTVHSFMPLSQPHTPYVDQVTFDSITPNGATTTSATLHHTTTPYGPSDGASYNFVDTPPFAASFETDDYDYLEPPDEASDNQPMLEMGGEESEDGKFTEKPPRDHQICP